MTSLTRTKQGTVSIEEAYTLEEIQKGNYHLYKVEEVLDYPKIIVSKELEFKIKNGVRVPNEWNVKDRCTFLNEENNLLGIYEVENQELKVWKNF